LEEEPRATVCAPSRWPPFAAELGESTIEREAGARRPRPTLRSAGTGRRARLNAVTNASRTQRFSRRAGSRDRPHPKRQAAPADHQQYGRALRGGSPRHRGQERGAPAPRLWGQAGPGGRCAASQSARSFPHLHYRV